MQYSQTSLIWAPPVTDTSLNQTAFSAIYSLNYKKWALLWVWH